MILFKPYHVHPIVVIDEDPMIRKTQTRRVWKKQRAKIGSRHQCKTRMFTVKDDYFALVEILDVYEQPLGDMTEEDARAEGGYTLAEYARIWEIINKAPPNPLQEVFVVEMECVEVKISPSDLVKYGSMYREHMRALRGIA